MNKLAGFEDILAWQKARALTKNVYACTRVGDFTRWTVDRGLWTGPWTLNFALLIL